MTNEEYRQIFRDNHFDLKKIAKVLNITEQEVIDIFAKMYD